MDRENEKLFVKEFIELIEKHGMILCYPGFLKGHSILLDRDNPITQDDYERILKIIKETNEIMYEEIERV